MSSVRTSSITKGVMPSGYGYPPAAPVSTIREEENGAGAAERDESSRQQQHRHRRHHHRPDEEVIPSSPTRETTATTIALDDDDDDDLSDELSEDVEAAKNGGGCRPGRLFRASLKQGDCGPGARQSCDLGTEDITPAACSSSSAAAAHGGAPAASAAAAPCSASALLRTSGADLYYAGGDVDPPPTRFERSRDSLLRMLDTRPVQWLGIIILVQVIADGAVFFFFLMGWQTLCSDPSPTDCEPRNTIYNASIQILTGLFTAMALISFPWRATQFSHAWGLNRVRSRHQVGLDLYGVPSHDVWYHIPAKHRRGITGMLVLSCLLQYLNQATRLVFRSYEAQSTFPGTVWVNVFFASSFVTAFAGGVWMASVSESVRRRDPAKFEPGPIQLVLASRFGTVLCRLLGCRSCCGWDLEVAKIEVEAQDREVRESIERPDVVVPLDPTTSEVRAHLPRRASRAELRMFAM
jgi:hypothetical protein